MFEDPETRPIIDMLRETPAHKIHELFDSMGIFHPKDPSFVEKPNLRLVVDNT